MGTQILPGVYITVQDEGLISAGGVSVGTVGVVGIAEGGTANQVEILSSFADAKKTFGRSVEVAELAVNGIKEKLENPENKDNVQQLRKDLDVAKGKLKTDSEDRYKSDLLEALELVFANGGSTVYAVKIDDSNGFSSGLEALKNETVNIVMLAGQDATKVAAISELKAHLNSTADIRRERIGVVGCGESPAVETVTGNVTNVVDDDGRLVYVTPGAIVKTKQTVNEEVVYKDEIKSGAYMAAAVTGLIASLPVRTSPTNKLLNFSGKLATNYNFGELTKLVETKVLAVEKRDGFRVVRGVTTSPNPAWEQITTRRIVDKAIYGVRSACNPYIGKLNNTRVRGAMKATIDGFLTRMVQEESLTSYELDVTATRSEEIAGIAAVTLSIKPTFSIDYIQVTMTLG
jgi:hypothetical protein